MARITLRPPKAPNLLVAPILYDQRYVDQLTNALRLYFNQVDNGLANLFDDTGGSNLSIPFIALSDSSDQLATNSNTPTVIVFTNIEGSNGFTLVAPGSAKTAISGIFKITFSLQLTNTDNTAHDAAVWARVNGVDVPRSSTIFSVPARKSAGVFSYICAYSEMVVSLNATDIVEIYWAPSQAFKVSPATAGIYIEHLDAITSPYVRPATPSSIASITFISRLP